MKKVFGLAIAAMMGFASTGSAASVTLIDATTGNGDFLSDPAGVAAPAGAAVNGAPAAATNGFGRALSGNGTSQGGSLTDFTTVTDNRGVTIGGWGVYRTFYNGGSDALGFLENGDRLGKANVAFDGQAFANSSDYVLLSDPIAHAGTAGDSLDWSILAGHDIGDGFTIDTYVIFDDATGITADASNTFAATPVTTVSGSVIAAADYSTVRLGFFVDATQTSNTRVLLDDARLTVISAVPEPGALALLSVAGIGMAVRRRRRS